MKITIDNASFNQVYQVLCVIDPKRTAKLVEVKNTPTNSGYTTALENIVKWLLGEKGDFPEYTGNGHYYWRTELRKRLNAAKARHCV